VAQFSERVPMVRGRLDAKASTATGYAWVVWRKPLDQPTGLVWIPPCRKGLERLNDYDTGTLRSAPKPRRALSPAETADLFSES